MKGMVFPCVLAVYQGMPSKHARRLQNTSIRSMQQNSITITLQMKGDDKVAIDVPKGLLTLAVHRWSEHICNVAECGDFKISVESSGFDNKDKQGHGSLTIFHVDSGGGPDTPICSLLMNEWHAVAVPLVASINTGNILLAAEHVWKKQSIVPATTCIGSLQLEPLPASLIEFQTHYDLTSTSFAVPPKSETYSLPHKFKAFLHYNCKLVSLLQSSGIGENLSACRGLLVNSAMAWNCTMQSQLWPEAILAQSLQVAPLVNSLPRDAHSICARLSLKTSEGLHKIPVYAAGDDAMEIISHSLALSSKKASKMFYFFSKNNMPVLITSTLCQSQTDRSMQCLQDSRTNHKKLLLKAYDQIETAQDALALLHAARQVHKQQVLLMPASQRKNNANAAEWRNFVRQWLYKSSTKLPEAGALLSQAVNLDTCDCLPALLCMAQDFSPVCSRAKSL